jgi:DDE domain
VVVSRVLHICVFLVLFSSSGQRGDDFFLLGYLDIRLHGHEQRFAPSRFLSTHIPDFHEQMPQVASTGILPEVVELRQVKYLNNLVEQDHRFIKRLVKPGMGFFSFATAWRTLQGYEVMNMRRKGEVQRVNKGNIPNQTAFSAELFGLVI